MKLLSIFLTFLIIICFTMAACGSGKFQTPTSVALPTFTPTPISIPTFTPTPRFQAVLSQTATLYSGPGNGNYESLASLSVLAGNPGKATRLIGWADTARKKIGDVRPPIEQKDVDQDEATCRLALGEVAFLHAYEAGRAMTLEQAVAYALDAN